MEFSKEDRVIDLVLSKLNYNTFNQIDENSLKTDFKFSTGKELDIIFKVAEDYDLIDRRGKNRILWMTAKGYQIQKTGGWLKYLEQEKRKEIIENERQAKTDKILDLDLKLKNFEAKIGKKIVIAGIIITVLSFIISLLTTKFFESQQPSHQERHTTGVKSNR